MVGGGWVSDHVRSTAQRREVTHSTRGRTLSSPTGPLAAYVVLLHLVGVDRNAAASGDRCH
jgi:hypothetical protein